MKKKLALLLLAIASALCVAFALPSCSNNGDSRLKVVEQIELGYNKSQVIDILGEPYDYDTNSNIFTYYSDNYLSLLERNDSLDFDNIEDLDDLENVLEEATELEERLQTEAYEYIEIYFNDKGKVISVFFDAARSEQTKDKVKKSSTHKILSKNLDIENIDIINIIYSVYFTDGSYYLGEAPATLNADTSGLTLEWIDSFDNTYEHELDSNIVSGAYYFSNTNTVYIYSNDTFPNECPNEIGYIVISDEVTSITIPAGITFVAFHIKNNSLTNITVEPNNNYHSSGNCIIETESRTLMLGCKNSVIPTDGSVTRIGRYAFSNCSNLTSITIPKGVTSIGDSAFEDCDSLTSITIPSSVTSIGDSAFSGCDSLTSITIPSSVTSIGYHAFWSCTNIIEIENGVSYVDKWVVECDTSDTTVTLRTNTIGIADSAFEDCDSLTSITIPSSVTSIGASAFRSCSSLTSITIPDSVTSIGGYAFSSCSSLQYNEYENALYLGNENNPYVVLFKVKDTSLTTYTINQNTKCIYDSAFERCSSLTSITIPEGVTSIGNSAFERCSSLTSITIPESVTSIGGSAFEYCSSLESITIPKSVTSIGGLAFYRCSRLENLFYAGTAEEWETIEIGSYNSPLTSATRYYYSETEPTRTGNYWHYVDGVVTVW